MIRKVDVMGRCYGKKSKKSGCADDMRFLAKIRGQKGK